MARATFKYSLAYGNYIDEVLLISTSNTGFTSIKFYAHDHLYSPVALIYATGSYVFERYEYDAYGEPTIWDGTFSTTRQSSNYGNFYLFTGRRVDILDNGSLKIQYNRNRYYDYYTGRWLTQDPLGVTPTGGPENTFSITAQYRPGLSLNEAFGSKPTVSQDPYGLIAWPPDPAEPPEPGTFTPPRLTRGLCKGLSGCWECCSVVADAIARADTVLSAGGPCSEWFTTRYSHGETYRVGIWGPDGAPGPVPMPLITPGLTAPFSTDIFLACWACHTYSEPWIATILIHEVAHHYTGLPGILGEWEADGAVETCMSELMSL